MAQNVNPTFVKTLNLSVTQITTGLSNAGSVACYTGGVNGSKLVSCLIAANTTLTQDVRINVVAPGLGCYINTVSVPSQAGFVSGQSPVNGLTNCPLAIDNDGNPHLILPSTGWSFQAQITSNSSQWTTGSALYVIVSAGDF